MYLMLRSCKSRPIVFVPWCVNRLAIGWHELPVAFADIFSCDSCFCGVSEANAVRGLAGWDNSMTFSSTWSERAHYCLQHRKHVDGLFRFRVWTAHPWNDQWIPNMLQEAFHWQYLRLVVERPEAARSVCPNGSRGDQEYPVPTETRWFLGLLFGQERHVHHSFSVQYAGEYQNQARILGSKGRIGRICGNTLEATQLIGASARGLRHGEVRMGARRWRLDHRLCALPCQSIVQ